MGLRVAVVTAALAVSSLAANFQKPNIVLPPTAVLDRAAVKEAFVTAYSTYRRFAFGHDDLKPVSRGVKDSRNGWGATIFDGMSTMLIMGLTVCLPVPF
jgi:mannosyl-oligosaccharide alpha-1,2-mannosidase